MAKDTKKTNKKSLKFKEPARSGQHEGIVPTVVDLPAKLVQSLADEVAKTVISRLPHIPRRSPGPRKSSKVENSCEYIDKSNNQYIDIKIYPY